MILIFKKITAVILLIGILNWAVMPARAVETDPAQGIAETSAEETTQETSQEPGTEDTQIQAISETDTAPETITASESFEETTPVTEAEAAEEATTATETEPPEEISPEGEEQPEETAPAPVRREMPLYFQNDYPDARFGNGTVETDGCGITPLPWWPPT